MPTNMNVANEILRQLGGQRFAVFTGARDFTGDATSLTFKLPKAKDGIKSVTVRLDPSDTYTVTFHKIARAPSRAVKESEGVYCDSLVELFESTTGLYTHL
jgi:hypothetical protein